MFSSITEAQEKLKELNEEAMEEAVVNSVYHRDFLQHEPIEITIEPSGISILNCPARI